MLFTFVLFISMPKFGDMSSVEQKFVKEPESISVKEGDNFTLSCSVKNKVGVLQWTKDDFGLGTSRSLVGYERYRMVGEEGSTWDLQIDNATLDDDARFQCQVGATERLGPIRSNYASVEVLASPQPPIITAGPKMVLREGEIALVQCISKGGKPASVITWRRNGELIKEGIEEKVAKMVDGKRSMTVSTLSFLVVADITGESIECEASNEALDEAQSVETVLEVEYKPVVQMNVDSESIYEGDTVKITCEAKAFPTLVAYQWTIDGQEIKEASGAKELVIDVTRSMNGKVVSCSARNKIGQDFADLMLNINYSPVFVISPGDVTGNNGDKINLRCEVDSNPPAVVSWTKDGNKSERFGRGTSLSFILSNETSGFYACEASVSGFSTISAISKVQRQGSPVIVAEKWKWTSLGDSVMIACEAESYPLPTEISWKFSGKFIKPDSADFTILETQDGRIVKSMIIIKNVKSEQFGEYECNFKNDIGKASSKINLIETDPLPILIVISAGISGVLLTIVLIVIVMTCKNVSKASESRKTWSETQSKVYDDRCSNASSETTESNTTSSLSSKGSRESPESFSERNFTSTKIQPDIVNSHPPTPIYSHNYDYANQYSDYRQFKSEHNLVDHLQFDNYFNPFTQITVPVCTSSVKSSAGCNSPLYGNIDPAYVTKTGNGELRTISGSCKEDNLNESSAGTHV